MSQTVPPDTRAEHPDGPLHGRMHGSPQGSPQDSPQDSPRGSVQDEAAGQDAPAVPVVLGVRAALMRACLLPAAAMALLGGATAVLTRVGDPSGRVTSLVGLMAAAAAALIVAAAYRGVNAAIRQVHDQLFALRSMHARGIDELSRFVEGVRRGDRRGPSDAGTPPATSDPFALLAHDVRRFQRAAQEAALQTANPTAGPDQRVDVFVNLAWRMQSLVHREIRLLDDLEAQVEDPDLLKGLFTVDHLATLLRRQTESLAVLGGAASRRRWTNPVTMYDLLRSAVAEVEQYSRVKLVLPINGMVHGDAVAHIIHLVAELVENATKFSAPDTQVLIRAEDVPSGLAIEVEDRGLGIPPGDRRRMNDVLADPGQVNIGELLRDGRIGLFVVSALARRHGVKVELRQSIFGGTQAVVVLPRELVQAPVPDASPQPAATTATTARTADPAATPAQTEEAAANGMTLITATTTAPDPSAPEAAGGLAAIPDAVGSRATDVDTPWPEDGENAGGHAAVPPPDGTRGASRGDDRPDGRTEPVAERPSLPQRRMQQSLAPQLREPPAPESESNVEPTPDLMADFLRGFGGMAEEEDRPVGDQPVDGSGDARPTPVIPADGGGQAQS